MHCHCHTSLLVFSLLNHISRPVFSFNLLESFKSRQDHIDVTPPLSFMQTESVSAAKPTSLQGKTNTSSSGNSNYIIDEYLSESISQISSIVPKMDLDWLQNYVKNSDFDTTESLVAELNGHELSLRLLLSDETNSSSDNWKSNWENLKSSDWEYVQQQIKTNTNWAESLGPDHSDVSEDSGSDTVKLKESMFHELNNNRDGRTLRLSYWEERVYANKYGYKTGLEIIIEHLLIQKKAAKTYANDDYNDLDYLRRHDLRLHRLLAESIYKSFFYSIRADINHNSDILSDNSVPSSSKSNSKPRLNWDKHISKRTRIDKIYYRIVIDAKLPKFRSYIERYNEIE